jgi:hypothetical protein
MFLAVCNTYLPSGTLNCVLISEAAISLDALQHQITNASGFDFLLALPNRH